MADAGFKLSVEGEKEFKKALAEINNQIKANAAELKMLTAQYTSTDSSMEKLTANQRALETSLETQGQKVALLREQYEKAAAEYGETDRKVVKLKTDLANATVEYSKMSAEVEKNQAAINANWEAMEKFRDATAKVEDSVGGLDEIMAQNRREVEALAEQYRVYGESARDAAKKQENLTAQNKLLTDSVENQRKKVDALNDQLEAARRVYGDTSDEVREYQDAVNNATGELEEMEQQIKDNNEAMSQSDDAVSPLGGALDDILDKLGIQMPEALNGLSGEGGGFPKAAVAAGLIATAIVESINKLNELTAEAAAWADETARKAQTTGLDPEKLQALEYAGKQMGVSLEVIEDALKEIGIKTGEADEAIEGHMETVDDLTALTREEYEALTGLVNEETKLWDTLGVEIYTASGKIKDSETIFYELLDALKGVSNEAERMNIMNQLLGESSKELMPFINSGSEAVKELTEEAKELGYVVEEDVIESLDEWQVYLDNTALKVDTLKRYLANVWVEVRQLVKGDGSIPELTESFRDLGDALDRFLGVDDPSKPANKFFEKIREFFSGISVGHSSLPTLGKYPGYATGTYNHIGGYALVGEKGPEIVQLPQGSRVYPNGQAPQMGVSNVYNVTISARDVREFNDIVRIAQSERQSIRMGYSRR